MLCQELCISMQCMSHPGLLQQRHVRLIPTPPQSPAGPPLSLLPPPLHLQITSTPVQVLSNELADASACLPSSQEQHPVLIEGLAGGTCRGQQASQRDAGSALKHWTRVVVVGGVSVKSTGLGLYPWQESGGKVGPSKSTHKRAIRHAGRCQGYMQHQTLSTPGYDCRRPVVLSHAGGHCTPGCRR